MSTEDSFVGTDDELVPFQLGQHVHRIYGLLSASKLADIQSFQAFSSGMTSNQYVLAMLNVADVMIPMEILNYFGEAHHRIAFVRFFKCCFQDDRYLVLLYFHTADDMLYIFERFNGNPLSIMLELMCEFYWVRSVSLVRKVASSLSSSVASTTTATATANDVVISSMSDSSNSSSSEASPVESSKESLKEEEIEDYIELENAFSLIEDYSLLNASVDKERSLQTSMREDKCSICLEELYPCSTGPSPSHSGAATLRSYSPKDFESSSTPQGLVVLHCSHVFHFACIQNVENASCCPVCRYQHDSTTANMKKVNVTCVVCQSTGQSNSSKHLLGSGMSPFSSSSPSFSSSARVSVHTGVQPTRLDSHYHPSFVDLWLCITCGFIGCGETCSAHNYHHFLETKHTYIMNVVDQNVWDYSGSGYVYRIALETELANNDTTNVTQPRSRTKITEVANLSFNPQDFRSSFPPSFDGTTASPIAPRARRSQHVSSGDELLDQKMGNLHQQYQRTLNWRLDEMKAFYEQRVQSIWKSVGRTDFHQQSLVMSSEGKAGAEESLEASSDLAWTEHIKASLNLEKLKLTKQCQMMQEKLDRIAKEKDVNHALETHLQRNKGISEQKIDDLKRNLQEAEVKFGEAIPALEAKVMQLMQQLDSTSSSAKSTSYHVGESGVEMEEEAVAASTAAGKKGTKG